MNQDPWKFMLFVVVLSDVILSVSTTTSNYIYIYHLFNSSSQFLVFSFPRDFPLRLNRDLSLLGSVRMNYYSYLPHPTDQVNRRIVDGFVLIKLYLKQEKLLGPHTGRATRGTWLS